MNTELLYLKFDKKLEDGSIAYGAAFPSDNEQVILGTYTYEAKRMGGAPTITDTFNFPRCLDNEWKKEGNSEVYVDYDGDRFYVSSIPSPTKDNTNGMYKHEITLTSRREILDNTLFFDVVTEHTDMLDKDRYRSNQTKFSFGGDIREFIKRINDSLVYVGIYDPTKEEGKQGYHLVLKDGYGTDEIKEISIENRYITEVIQEIYNTFNLTYYWKGEVCYVGEYENDLTADNDVVEYGRNKQLLSVAEENTNNKIVDMVTGYGSSDNIPYYYPNDDEFGKAEFETKNIEKKNVIVDLTKLFGHGDPIGKEFTFCKVEAKEYDNTFSVKEIDSARGTADEYYRDSGDLSVSVKMECTAGSKIKLSNLKVLCDWEQEDTEYVSASFSAESLTLVRNGTPQTLKELNDNFVCDEDGTYEIIYQAHYEFGLSSRLPDDVSDAGYAIANCSMVGTITISYNAKEKLYFVGKDTSFEYGDGSITFTDKSLATPAICGYRWDNGWVPSDVKDSENAAKVTVIGRVWLDPSQNLMPSIYRNTQGAERFYYATDTPPAGYEDIYKIPGTDKNYTFKNKYVMGNPHQGSVSFDDIKPTINGIRNDVIQEDGLGQLFGEIADVAFDSADSDVTDSDGNYEHQYFYIKLHKFSGEFGFDLFNHALAKENAVINMIDCQGCPACAFPVKTQPSADNSKMYNCVSTDGNGNLVSLKTDKDDYILGETEAQNDKLNQNSQEKEIWIAVQKDASTLGIVMPNAAGNFKPKKGDKFVITGIRPPKVLITAAEDRLDKALIKYMSENNEDQFNYTIKFSRIFLAENKDFTDKLNENAKICLKFNGIKHELFVSNYSVKRDGNALADVEIELVKSLEVTQSEIKQMIESVKGDMQSNLGGLNTGGNSSFNAAIADKMYISKIKDDTAQGTITFNKVQRFMEGLTLGDKTHYVDGKGNAVLKDVALDRIHDPKSTPAERVIIGAQGFDLYMGDDNKAHLYLDYLTVRNKAFFSQLEIRKVSYSGGTLLLSNAGSTIVKVVYIFDEAGEKVIAYKCYAAADDGTTATFNYWKVGMMALCQTFNVKSGVYKDVSNRYYWRLCVGTGQETLEDGKLYDWIILSNVREFGGGDAILPSYALRILADENRNYLSWGGVLVAVNNKEANTSLASLLMKQDGITQDEGNTPIADRKFWGYEEVDGGEPDAPQIGDVIVNVGDQVKWNSRGNVIKLSTSTEDNGSDNAPSFWMYHGIGAPRKTDAGIINVWQWKKVTALFSPVDVRLNAENLKFFTGDDPFKEYDPWADTLDKAKSYTTSQLKITNDALEATTSKLNFKKDENGKWVVDNISKSGLITTDNMSTQFSQLVDKDGNILAVASIKTSIITKDGAKGTTNISQVDINGDKINIDANHKLTIKSADYLVIESGNFKLDKDGNCTMTGEVNATKGKIGIWNIGVNDDGTATGTLSSSKTDISTTNKSSELGVGYFNVNGYNGSVSLQGAGGSGSRGIEVISKGASTTAGYFDIQTGQNATGIQVSSSGTGISVMAGKSGYNALYVQMGDIYLRTGCIKNFRMKKYTVTSGTSYTIGTLYDETVLLVNVARTITERFTVNLPSNPPDGTIYFVRKTGQANVIVKGKVMSEGGYPPTSENESSITWGILGIFIYDAANGYYTGNWCDRFG